MNRYTIYCTEAQTKKAVELSAPVEICNERIINIPPRVYIKNKHEWYKLPTAEQMLLWLEENNIHVCIMTHDLGTCGFCYDFEINDFLYPEIVKKSRREATIAAIDAALEFLSNNKK